ncbi:MAG: hypothetical protein JSS79_03555 [Bacteroidetes bacterium]|nr:hypothetical protein [Bacteroidota bacterium]
MKFFLPLFALMILLVAACHTHSDPTPSAPSPNEPGIFTYSPIEKSKINYILSLGWIQPSGHTIPSDHIYFFFPHQSGDPVLPVQAPGGGLITKILEVPVLNVRECKVWIKMNDKFTYYLDHIVPADSLKEGSTIKAGQTIATTGIGNSIDLGVTDFTVQLDFANPKRYNDETIHCGKPLTYFADSLKTTLYAKVDREGSDKDGRIDIDVKGSLAGNWFLDGTTFYTDGPSGWNQELSFAFDIQHPQKILVSIGGTLGLTGKWGIPSDAPLPSAVSVASGKVAYKLLYTESLTQAGLMIVQMIDADHIKIEVFPNSQQADAEFDANALKYAR